MTDKKKRAIGLLINLLIIFIFFWIQNHEKTQNVYEHESYNLHDYMHSIDTNIFINRFICNQHSVMGQLAINFVVTDKEFEFDAMKATGAKEVERERYIWQSYKRQDVLIKITPKRVYWVLHLIALILAWRLRAKPMEILLALYRKI